MKKIFFKRPFDWSQSLKPITYAFLFVFAIAINGRAQCFYVDGTAAAPRGFSSEIFTSPTSGPLMLRLYRMLSVDERAVLSRALTTPNVALVTQRCGPNDLFWSHLSNLGWFAPVNDLENIAAHEQAYVMTGEGATVLPTLIAQMDAM